MAAIDILPDGTPPETPELSADTAYMGIPALGAQRIGEDVVSMAESAGRVAAHAGYPAAQGWSPGFLPSWLYDIARGTEEDQSLAATLPDAPFGPAGSIQSPMLSRDEYETKYAPIGNDGKPISLGDGPMPEGVAKLIGEAKRQEIERENVIGRFEGAHGSIVNFLAGGLGFLLDPLRASTAFIPGIGEEAITAQLGTGLIGRTLARLGAGAAGGAAAQAPVSALQYGLGQQEASDYDLRDAFRDIAFGAAGNALWHAGFGGLGDVWRWRSGAAVPGGELAPELPQAAPILEADATTQHAAISAAVSQLTDGRPVDVEAFYRPPQAETAVGLAMREPGPARIVAAPTIEAQARLRDPELFAQRDQLMDEAAQLRQTDPARAIDQRTSDAQDALRTADTAANVLPTDLDAEQLRALVAQRGAERDAAARQLDQLQARRETDIAAAANEAQARLQAIDYQLRDMAPRLTAATEEARNIVGAAAASRATVTGPQPRLPDPAEVVAGQRQLWRDGFASGVPGNELRATMRDIYSPEPTAPRADSAAGAGRGEGAGGVPMAPKPDQRAPGPSAGAGEHATQPGLLGDPEIMDAERRLAAMGADLLPEERASLDASEAALRLAEQRAAAVHEAAACLAEAGL